MKYLYKTEKGIALLFSILLTAALLLVALGIAELSYKEGVFSIEARDSNRAFVAADTGIECALYMDANDAFNASTTGSASFYCHNIPVNIYSASSTSFNFPLALGPTSCAMIYVDKALAFGTSTKTQIESYGYNVRQSSAGSSAYPPVCVTAVSNVNVVNRALQVNYPNP